MSSSALILSPSLPMEKLGSNCDSDESSRDATGCVPSPTESSRRRRCAIPWLMLPPESSVYKFYRLAEGDVIQVEQQQKQEEFEAVSSCWGLVFQGWVAYVRSTDCQIVLFNPLSGKSFNLPSIETLHCIKGVTRNTHSGLVESFLDPYCYPHAPQEVSTVIIKKMILSSSPLDDECIALVILGLSDKLAFCRRPRPGDDPNCWAWTVLDSTLEQYNQIVFDSRKKLFFAYTDFSELEAWDLHSDPVKRFLVQCEDFDTDSWPTSSLDDVELEQKDDYCWLIYYLVYDHQSQELFIVTRYTAAAIDQDGSLIYEADNLDDQHPYKTRFFDVFKLDFIDHDHVELQKLEGSLGDRAFFIGSNPGFALSTSQFPELRPNSIYFTDNLSWAYRHIKTPFYGGHDMGIYDCEERSFLSCYYPIDLEKIQRIVPAPFWFIPDVDAECLA